MAVAGKRHSIGLVCSRMHKRASASRSPLHATKHVPHVVGTCCVHCLGSCTTMRSSTKHVYIHITRPHMLTGLRTCHVHKRPRVEYPRTADHLDCYRRCALPLFHCRAMRATPSEFQRLVDMKHSTYMTAVSAMTTVPAMTYGNEL